MERGTFDDLYLEWLYNQVVVEPQKLSYWRLMRHLYSTEFTWFVPNDDNRAADGRDLRVEWADGAHIDPPARWLQLGCSVLEMLIALARHMEFEAEETPEYWFWHLMENLGFQGYHDKGGYSSHDVTRRLKILVDRLYDHTGRGGLFPLRSPSKDQRKVELWYQMSEYLLQDL